MNNNSYRLLHKRVVRLRGKASQHKCARCIEYDDDRQALDWATVHGTDGLDLWADYVSLCRSCHKKYDYVDSIGSKISRAQTGRPKSPEAVAKTAAARRGQKHTPEAIEKMRQAKLGSTASPETRAKQSAAHQWFRHTPEAIEVIRQAKLDYWARLSPAERSELNRRRLN